MVNNDVSLIKLANMLLKQEHDMLSQPDIIMPVKSRMEIHDFFLFIRGKKFHGRSGLVGFIPSKPKKTFSVFASTAIAREEIIKRQ